MPWSTSDRASRLPHDWPTRRQATRRRAHGQCEHHNIDGARCTAHGTECDHITPGDNHSLTNLQWLCSDHHAAKTRAEATDAMRAIYAKARHPREQHPGLR